MADTEPTQEGKRRVRNPETFRERALKATTEQAKPAAKRPVRTGLGVFSRSIGRFFRRLFQVQPFKAIGWLGKQVGRIIIPRYLRNAAGELRMVSWPNWQQSRRLTYAVLIFAIVFGAAIATVDYGLGKLFKAILLK